MFKLKLQVLLRIMLNLFKTKVELYYDNSKKFETTSTGVTITGGISATGGTNAIGIQSGGQYFYRYYCFFFCGAGNFFCQWKHS